MRIVSIQRVSLALRLSAVLLLRQAWLGVLYGEVWPRDGEGDAHTPGLASEFGKVTWRNARFFTNNSSRK